MAKKGKMGELRIVGMLKKLNEEDEVTPSGAFCLAKASAHSRQAKDEFKRINAL